MYRSTTELTPHCSSHCCCNTGSGGGGAGGSMSGWIDLSDKGNKCDLCGSTATDHTEEQCLKDREEA